MNAPYRFYTLPLLLIFFGLALSLFYVASAHAQDSNEETPSAQQDSPIKHQEKTPNIKLITTDVIEDIRNFVNTDIVRLSIDNQNAHYKNIDNNKVLELDKQWRAETKDKVQPLISATLSNPLSSYLTRVQAGSKGLYTEIFVMDRNGLNVGQSNISSDYWQGDEAKFKKTFPEGPTAIFIDEPEFNEKIGTWAAQANMSVANQSGETIGAITVEINLTELQRRKTYKKNL